MRVLVCGGRDYNDRDHIWNTLQALHEKHGFTAVIHGHATGADSEAEVWASAKCGAIKVVGFRAEWQRLGKAAGPIRNQRMIAEGRPDLVVAFPGGRGTADMVRRAEAAGVEVIRVAPREDGEAKR